MAISTQITSEQLADALLNRVAQLERDLAIRGAQLELVMAQAELLETERDRLRAELSEARSTVGQSDTTT